MGKSLFSVRYSSRDPSKIFLLQIPTGIHSGIHFVNFPHIHIFSLFISINSTSVITYEISFGNIFKDFFSIPKSTTEIFAVISKKKFHGFFKLLQKFILKVLQKFPQKYLQRFFQKFLQLFLQRFSQKFVNIVLQGKNM